MGLPASKSALKRVGERIIAGTASAADLNLFEQTLIEFDALRQYVAGEVSSHPWPEHLRVVVTARTKTRATLLQKLQREHGIGLGAVRDIAGVRLVFDGTLVDQDDIVETLTALPMFESTMVIDRRVRPVRGYRAVHVIGQRQSMSVEVQVRTVFQDRWANLFERLADYWGRELRYAPDGPGRGSDPVRQQIVDWAISLSLGGIASVESDLAGGSRPGWDQVSEFQRQRWVSTAMEKAMVDVTDNLDALASLVALARPSHDPE